MTDVTTDAGADDFRPVARPEVNVEEKDGRFLVHFTPLYRVLDVSQVIAEVTRRLDGRPWTQILAEIEASGFKPIEAAAGLRRLMLLNLVHGAGDEIVAKHGRLARGEEKLPHFILEGARFQCQGSGNCCQNYQFGPLSDADVERISNLDIPAAFPHLVGRWLDTRDPDRGQPQRYLRSVDERCVFLLADRRCGLHARFGADAKPGFCQTYPLEQIATLDGIKLYDRGTCATFATSARSGPALVDELITLRTLLPLKQTLYHPLVYLGDDLPCDYGHILRWLRAALALIKLHRGDPATTLRAIGEGFRVLTTAALELPIGPGEPERTITAVVNGIESWYRPPADDEAIQRGAQVIASAAAELHTAIATMYAIEPGPAEELNDLVAEVGALATALADPSHPLPARLVEISAVTAGGPDVEEVLRISLRQQLFGSGGVIYHRLSPALLRIAFIQLIALHSARTVAHAAGRTAIEAADLSRGHMLAVRILMVSVSEGVLFRFTDNALDALDALPTLAHLT